MKIEIEIPDTHLARVEAVFGPSADSEKFAKSCTLAVLSVVGNMELAAFRQAESEAAQQRLIQRQNQINAEFGLTGGQ